VKFILSHVLAVNGKGTPYHWAYIWQKAEVGDFTANPRVFVVRAWGKRPSQSKAMCFKNTSQASAYYEKWKSDKTIEKNEELGQYDSVNDALIDMEREFPWLTLSEHAETLNEFLGTQTPVITINQPAKLDIQAQAKQLLPETYGWF
jgi:hypothetical protein